MTVPEAANQTQDQKTSDKELNFRKQEQMYQRMLAEKEARVQELERMAQESQKQKISYEDDDEDDSDPYIDKKKLKKTLAKFGEETKNVTQTEIQRAVQKALEEEKERNWLDRNRDFEEIMNNAQKFYDYDPELAEQILKMPASFERQKLVYKNIKALGLHKESPKQPSIQEKVDANRRSPFYQPSGVGTSPYASAGDFSSSGQKNAYDKMQELKNRLRL